MKDITFTENKTEKRKDRPEIMFFVYLFRVVESACLNRYCDFGNCWTTKELDVESRLEQGMYPLSKVSL